MKAYLIKGCHASLVLSLLSFFMISEGLVRAEEEELPWEARKLVKKRDREIEKIDKAFIKHLQAIKIDYAKKGDLDAANAVQELINEHLPEDARERLVGKWLFSSGNWKGERELRKDGVIIYGGKEFGKWKVDDEYLVLEFDGSSERFKLPPKDGKVSGRSSHGWGVDGRKLDR